MYESRKIMGDVHKNVSSSIEKRKDVLSEEQQYHRDSESRQDKAQLHLSNPTELGIEDYVIHELRKVFPREDISFKVLVGHTFPFLQVSMDYDNGDQTGVYFSYYDFLNAISPYDYVVAVCIENFEKALKGVTK